MLFKGTPRHPDIKNEFQRYGARFNGSTSFDRTNYYETFAANEKNLDWALGLEADRMVNSRVSKQDLASEMTVVRNEFEAGENSPNGVFRDRLRQVTRDEVQQVATRWSSVHCATCRRRCSRPFSCPNWC